MRYLASLLAALTLSLPSLAQTQVVELPLGDQSTTGATLTSAPATGSPSGQLQIPRDRLIELHLQRELNAASVNEGDHIHFIQQGDLVVDGKIILPAGTLWNSTITHVQLKTEKRNGAVKFSDPMIDLGHHQRLRMSLYNAAARKESREEVAFYATLAVIASPIIVALSPVLAVNAIRDRHSRESRGVHATRWKPVDIGYPEGYEYKGFVRNAVTLPADWQLPSHFTPTTANP